ncbi:uncharacterized protein V3H82_014260 isoform 2-T2 [Fundulus diaphanus]
MQVTEMSLQVCHCCGWSKVTTYQGLRVHQGKNGCTPKGMRIAEPQQQDMWGFTGQKTLYMSYKLDVPTTIKSDASLQICHCGWTQVTSYHGLRVHQGKMGCTPKGARIPKEEQKAWGDYWKPQVDEKKPPELKKLNKKHEYFPEKPRMRKLRNPAAAATVKTENNLRTCHATRSKPWHQSEEWSTPLKISEDYLNTGSCYNYATAGPAVKEEPKSPPAVSLQRYPDDCNGRSVHEFEDASPYLQINHRLKENPAVVFDKPAVQPEQQCRSVTDHPATPPVDPHEEKESLLSTSEQETPKAQLLKEIQTCLEKFKIKREGKLRNISPSDSACEINKSVSKHPTAGPPVQPRRKGLILLNRTPERAEKSSATDGAIFESKKDSKEEEVAQNAGASTRVSSPPANKSPFTTPPHPFKKPTDRKVAAAEQMSSRASERPLAPPVVPPKRNSRSFTVKQLSSRDIPNDLQGANKTREGMKVKELVQMFSVPAAQEKTAVPMEKLRPEDPQGKLLAQRRSTIPPQETRVQPKLEDRKEQINKSVSKHPTAGPPVQPERKGLILLNRTPERAEKSSATDGAIFESKKDSKEEEVAQNATDMAPEPTPTAAKRSQKEDLSMIEAAEPDISTSRKVKELAQMFAVQETAARPQPKRGPERGPSQLKLRAQRFLQTKPQETIVQLKEEEHGGVKPAQKLPDPTSTPTTMKTASSKATKHQDHRPSGEASELAGFCAGPKVKDLARMFSTKTI